MHPTRCAIVCSQSMPSAQYWTAITISADGTKLAATVEYGPDGVRPGNIWTSSFHNPPSSPPPSRPPLAPPPPPPSPPEGSTTVVVSLTVAGAVSDFDGAKLTTVCGKIASAAGLEESAATCTVAAASVVITATLTVPPGQTVQAVTDTLNAAIGSTALATSVLGVTVEVAPTVADSSGATISPTPTPAGLTTGALVGIILGAVIGVIVVILLIVWRMKKRKTADRVSTM